jgi:16S rRNA (guanine966-N2)-methyltransferase
LRNNVESLGPGGMTKILRRDASDLGPAKPVEPFPLVFVDPLHGKGFAAPVSLRDGSWLTPGAPLMMEEAKAALCKMPEAFAERDWNDDTELVFLRARSSLVPHQEADA